MRERVREPIFNIPAVVLALLALLTLVHAARLLLSPEAGFEFVARFGFVPGRFGFLVDQQAVLDHLDHVAQASQEQGDVGQFFLTYAPPRELWFTPLSYAFLHGDWTHLIFNGVWLAAFGSPVARRFGAARFLALGALGAIVGAFFYAAFHLTELAPLVGASAGISAYMGAASRFVFEPGAFAPDDLGAPRAGRSSPTSGVSSPIAPPWPSSASGSSPTCCSGSAARISACPTRRWPGRRISAVSCSAC